MDKNILSQLADNPALFEAVKEAVLKPFTFNGFNVVELGKQNDEVIGQQARAIITGRDKIEWAFQEIARFKSTSAPKDKGDNPAR